MAGRHREWGEMSLLLTPDPAKSFSSDPKFGTTDWGFGPRLTRNGTGPLASCLGTSTHPPRGGTRTEKYFHPSGTSPDSPTPPREVPSLTLTKETSDRPDVRSSSLVRTLPLASPGRGPSVRDGRPRPTWTVGGPERDARDA